MPKQRITKDMIVQTAFEIAKTEGMDQVLVKKIAESLGCSVQPIYSYCEHMEGLKEAVVEKVTEYMQIFIKEHIDIQNLFQSTGRAYLEFAKEEPHLFKIFVLHERKNIHSLYQLYQTETNPMMAKYIAKIFDIDEIQARQLHLHMLIYTIGLGTILSTTQSSIPMKEIYEMQELAYEKFTKEMIQASNRNE